MFLTIENIPAAYVLMQKDMEFFKWTHIDLK